MIKVTPKNVITLYKLPKKIEFCKVCTVSNQRPRITIDSEGVCSACRFAVYKKQFIDWKKREDELKKLCEKYRSKD